MKLKNRKDIMTKLFIEWVNNNKYDSLLEHPQKLNILQTVLMKVTAICAMRVR